MISPLTPEERERLEEIAEECLSAEKQFAADGELFRKALALCDEAARLHEVIKELRAYLEREAVSSIRRSSKVDVLAELDRLMGATRC